MAVYEGLEWRTSYIGASRSFTYSMTQNFMSYAQPVKANITAKTGHIRF